MKKVKEVIKIRNSEKGKNSYKLKIDLVEILGEENFTISLCKDFGYSQQIHEETFTKDEMLQISKVLETEMNRLKMKTSTEKDITPTKKSNDKFMKDYIQQRDSEKVEKSIEISMR